MRFLHYGVLTVAIAACALNPAPVPLIGDSWSISDLAGEWSGEYQGKNNSRTGSIAFRLDAGRDTAYGDIVMSPRFTLGSRYNDEARPVRAQDLPRTLFIRFVRVLDMQVYGVMEPYRSPDCECMLRTTFSGVRRGDRIEGTYVTKHEDCDMPQEHGSWSAARKPR
jgi:hypothetical protein